MYYTIIINSLIFWWRKGSFI